MAREQRDRNIFDTAYKKLGKKTSPYSPPPPPPSEKKQLPPPSPTVSQNRILDPELRSMLKRIYEMKRDLDIKLKNLYAQGEKRHIDVDKYLNDPRNFPVREWQRIMKENEQLMARVNAAIGTTIAPKEVQKTHDTLVKERKGKTLGSRKKWIPVK